MKKGLTSEEKTSIGIWLVLFLMSSISNMILYFDITTYHQGLMILPFVIVVVLQFISLIEIILITSKR